MARRRTATERGTTLLLFPSAILVVFLLGALAVESASMFHAQRQAYRAASQAADDAAAMIDLDQVYVDGTVRIDPERATALARTSIAAAHLPGTVVGTPNVAVDTATFQVEVSLSIEIEPSFLRIRSAVSGPIRIDVIATSRLEQAP